MAATLKGTAWQTCDSFAWWAKCFEAASEEMPQALDHLCCVRCLTKSHRVYRGSRLKEPTKPKPLIGPNGPLRVFFFWGPQQSLIRGVGLGGGGEGGGYLKIKKGTG